MQIGCVRVTERALGAGPVDEAGAARARAMIALALDGAATSAPELFELGRDLRLVGLAGTVSTLAQLDRGLAHYDRDAIHHREISRASVEAWRDRLGAVTPDARLEFPGMVRGREDVIVAGLFVVDAVMARLGVSTLLASESDILDGVAAALQR
jgi:exopolyphosphatase / guanosine-5'-triphosphate,3'-diphosphate pyrophosphatase